MALGVVHGFWSALMPTPHPSWESQCRAWIHSKVLWPGGRSAPWGSDRVTGARGLGCRRSLTPATDMLLDLSDLLQVDWFPS